MQASPVKVSVLCPGWVQTRIGESDRNRPPELQDEAASNPIGEMGKEFLKSLVGSGLPPSEVAGRVLDAIREERFYILTHPEMTPMIEHRMEDITEGRNPAPSFFGA